MDVKERDMIQPAVRRKVVTFLALTLALSTVFWVLVARAGALGPLTSLGLMWCPGLAAILTKRLYDRSLRGLGWRLAAPRALLAGWGIPLAYCLAAYGLVWITGLGGFPNREFVARAARAYAPSGASPAGFMAVYLLVLATGGTLVSSLSALGEEIGWRGLLVPELAKSLSFTRVGLLSGGIWAVWHYPLILFGGYHNQGAPLWFGLLCFTALAVAISFIAAWLRLRTGSLWPAVLLHASHNLFVQNVFTPLTVPSPATPYLVDEFGVGLAIVVAAVAWLFWRQRGLLAPADRGAGP
jgi:uncharacterized protein